MLGYKESSLNNKEESLCLREFHQGNFLHCIAESKKDPIIEFVNYKVYELVDSEVHKDIVEIVNGQFRRIYRHIALYNLGNGYLFNSDENKINGPLGPCDYIADSTP